jgi:predicted N-acetyltransferase YhbS
MPPRQVRLAHPDEEPLLFRWMHEAWPHPLGLEAGLARRRHWAQHPWGQAHVQRWLLEEDGAPKSACQVYHLPLRVAGRSTWWRGFGSVVTPPQHRRQGHAEALLRALMAPSLAALEGGAGLPAAEAALLYSDIGTTYYGRMGFGPTALLDLSAPALPEAIPAWQIATPALASLALEARRAEEACAPWALQRSTEEAMAFWQGRSELTAYAIDGPQGPWWVWAKVDEGSLEVGAWLGQPGPGGAHRGLQGLAAALGAGEVVTWGTECPPGWTASPVGPGLPMVASLDGTQPSLRGPWWPIDHF